jgi:hypothetical protein
MSLATIRAQIKTAMESVAGIGIVTDFEPALFRQEDFERYYKPVGESALRGWSITREASSERDAITEQNWREHAMVLRGYGAIGADGASETAFQDLVETLCVRLRSEQRDQLGQQATFVGPPQVRICEPRVFAGFLVHYVEVTLRCTELVPIL